MDKGIITGYKDNTFKPTKVITRAELAKILYYYLGTSLSTAGKAYTGSDLKSDTANVTISESCTLSDATIDGDLYLTEGLASDAVQLNDVYVKGYDHRSRRHSNNDEYNERPHRCVLAYGSPAAGYCGGRRRSFSEHRGPQHSGALREKS